jgi:hypothetical protein
MVAGGPSYWADVEGMYVLSQSRLVQQLVCFPQTGRQTETTCSSLSLLISIINENDEVLYYYCWA